MPEKPKIINRTTLATTRLFRVEALDLQFSNGARRQFERIARSGTGGAVLIVPMLDANTVALVREYAAGVNRYELGFPKGKSEAGEDPLAAADRELKEEIGYGARSLQPLATFTLAPGYLEHTTDIILAHDLYPEKLPGDEPEPLEIVPWKLDRIESLLATGECTEARSVAAFFLTREFMTHEKS